MTALSTEIHAEDVVRLEGIFYKVVSVNLHAGGGKTGSMVHAKLRNLETGHIAEKRLATTERVDKIQVERMDAQFLYAEGENFVFMNQSNYEQLFLKQTVIGPAAKFLKEGVSLVLEMHDSKALAIDFPKSTEFKIISAGSGLKGDATYKEATLENGVTVMVPQFVREGDVVRVNVATGEFMDRVREKTGHEKQVYKPPEKQGTK